MIRKLSLISFSIVIIIVLSNIPIHAYTMADYWAFNEGNVWVYDRDFRVMGTETHDFTYYRGRQSLEAHELYSHFYIYSGPEGVLGVGIFDYETKQFVDFSATPIKLSKAEMNIGEGVTSNIPAGVVDDDVISITTILEAIETVTVPAGTFNNTLRVNIFINDGFGTYTEKIWLAKGVGAVQMYRVSETNNTPGCFFTCASLSRCGNDLVEERYTKLESFIRGTNRVVVIPLGN